MRRYLGVATIGWLLLAALAAPPVAFGATTHVVDCGSGADLQAAIGAAVSGDTLVIKGTCVGTFVIDKDLTLQGGLPGAGLDAHGAGTVLTIPQGAGRTVGATVRVSGLTIVGGNPAGIENWGHLTLEKSTVSGNTGVAIVHEGDFGGTEILLSATVSGNTGDGISGDWGRLTLRYSTVSGNTGDGIVGFDVVIDLYRSTVTRNGGSGIVARVQTSVALDHSTVSLNTGRGITNENGSVLVTDSAVSRNTGGGVYNGILGFLTVRHSTISGNTADFGAGIYIATNVDKYVVVEDSTITGNRARTSGGGVYTEGNRRGDVFTRVVISNNTAGVRGGGIYKLGGTLILTSVVFRNNTPDDCYGRCWWHRR